MRFSTAIVAGSFAVLASAASETSAAAQPASTSAVDQCVAKCPVADVNCKAHCIAVPSPDQNQANANTECARKCPQGSGSPADTKKFADCLQKCSHDYYYQTSVGTPESTGTPNSGNGGNNGGNGGNNGGSGSSGSGSNTSAGSGGNGGDASNTSAGSGGSDATGTGATKPTGTSGGSDASKTGSDAKATESGKGGDKKNGAAGLVASSAALFGAVVALFAL